MAKFICTNPSCGFIENVSGYSDAKYCPKCKTLSIEITGKYPAYRCESCAQITILENVADPSKLPKTKCGFCGNVAILIKGSWI